MVDNQIVMMSHLSLIRTTSNGSFCPQEFNCSGNLSSFDIGRAPTYVSIVSSCFSCVGSLLILLTYWILKEMRNTAQKIITLLAVADLVTALGYLLAGWNFLTHFNETDSIKCDTFGTVCEVQSFITTWSTLCSFGWTVALALHFCLVVRFCKLKLLSKLLVLENVVIWTVPTIIVIPLVATKSLGYTRYATSNWCYIADTKYPSSDLRDNGVTIALMLVAGNLWEMLSYITVIALYSLTMREYSIKIKAKASNQAGMEKRLLLIPLVFVLLRMWGTIQFFFSLATSSLNKFGCVPPWVQQVYLVLGILQAIGDGGQGWGNALLYIFLSSTIRHELFCSPCERLFCCSKREGDTINGLDSTSVMNITRNKEIKPLVKRNVNYGAVCSNSIVSVVTSTKVDEP